LTFVLFSEVLKAVAPVWVNPERGADLGKAFSMLLA